MKRKILSTIIILVLVLGSCTAAFADDSTNKQITVKVNDFKTLLDAKNGIKSSFSGEDVNLMEDQMRKELKKRIDLDDYQLKRMGYSDSDISELKKLTGDEPLATLAQTNALLATLTCYNSLDVYRYSTSQNTTYFSANISWSWNKMPIVRKTDIIGLAWNNSYRLCSGSSYNKIKISYLDTFSGKTSSVYKIPVENAIGISSTTFPVDTGNQEYAKWAKSGSGLISLSVVGKKLNSKFEFKYGHQGLSLGAPSVSLPLGIGFSFSNVQSTFTPASGIVNASSPTIVN